MNVYEIGVGIIFFIACVLWFAQWLAYRRVYRRLGLMEKQIVITRRVLDAYIAEREADTNPPNATAFWQEHSAIWAEAAKDTSKLWKP